ncbi:MAG: hypothetical protein SNJ69_15675 [Chloroflexaceae bacterium]
MSLCFKAARIAAISIVPSAGPRTRPDQDQAPMEGAPRIALRAATTTRRSSH